MEITRTKKQKGFVLITMGVVAVAMLGALGLAIDLGRIFIIRNETQAFCDSAAVAAASFLNNTSAGVQSADAAAKATSIAWNFSTTAVSSPTVEYATTSSGPWSNATSFPTAGAKAGDPCSGGVGNSDPACGYRFARVKTSVAAQLYFLPLVETAATKTYTMTVNSQAIAGQVDISGGTPSSPYTGVAEGCYTVNAPVNGVGSGCPNGTTAVSPPNFGLTIGNDTSNCLDPKNAQQVNKAVGCYDIQWSKFNSSGGGNGKPCQTSPAKDADNCFVSPPCANDQGGTAAEIAIINNWASSSNGYWGQQSASSIGAEVIDYQPNPNLLIPVTPGSNIFSVLTSGQQQTQSTYLDERVNQDPANWETTYTAYLADSSHNGRRLLLSPVVTPASATQTVVQGYGLYFLLSDASGAGQQSSYYKKKTVGNDPYCAIYVGAGCVGCTGNGVGGTTGSSKIALVQ